MKLLGKVPALLLGVLLSMSSPAAWAVLCTQLFFPGPGGDGLNGNVAWGDFPLFDASSSPVLTAVNRVGASRINVGNSYWRGGISGNGWRLETQSTGTAWVYVDGNLTISNNSEVNRWGSPSNLIILVRGNLTIQNSNNIYVNAMIYATGTATIGNNPKIRGAISSGGSMSKGNNIIYDASAIPGTDFGTLCDNPDSLGQIDHFRFLHAASGLSCNPLDVVLQACANADCSRRYEGSINATLSPSTWEGGNQVYFNGGQASLRLRGVGQVTLGIAATPSANNSLRCSTADCRVYFADSGFVFDVPDLLAGKPHVNVALQAMRTEPGDPQRCVPGFGPATRTLQFWSEYVDPGTGSMPVHLNGAAISTAPSSLTLNFDNTATAYLAVRYDDAGRMRLQARYVGTGAESGLDMRGSDMFVSRPYGLHISTPADAGCTTATPAACGVLRMAGDSFPLSVRAVAWQADGEPLTEAALRDNPTTPNFRLNGIALNSTALAPTDGTAGAFYRHDASSGTRSLLSSYAHVSATTTLEVSQSEVGIFRIVAAPPLYLGQSIGGGESGLIGRFTPAWLGVTSQASLSHACGTFSYQGQPIPFAGGQPALRVTGYNRQGEVTRNYDRGAFWRLDEPPQRQPYSLIAAGRPNLAARLQSLGDARSLTIPDSGAADGSRSFDWRADAASARLADALSWQLPASPSSEDLPLTLDASGAYVALQVSSDRLVDLDGVCYRGSDGAAASCQDFVHAVGGTQVRLGRLRIESARGPEDQPLDLPYWLESWQTSVGGPGWGKNADDVCSTPAVLGDVLLAEFSGVPPLEEADFPVALRSLQPPSGTPLPSGLIRLPAPDKQGSVLVRLSGQGGVFPEWLKHDWVEGNGLETPSARATFGSQAVQRALIFRREIYRQ